MALEVRLEKPSHPEKWDLPTDLSLLSALQRARDSTTSKTAPLPPKHELFLSNRTSISVIVELHRKVLEDTKQIDSALLSPVKKRLGGAVADPAADTGAVPSPSAAAVATPTAKTPKAKKAPQKRLSMVELDNVLQVTPFTRMVILMPYGDDHLLRNLNDGINTINSRALPNIQGTIRSYSLSPAERTAALDGSLDLISGFMIIDDDLRLIVLEGLAKPSGAMETLYIDYLLREHDNTEGMKVLCNPEILFAQRAYVDFAPDIRRIRIRNKLQKLVNRPEVYNRQQVEVICFEGIAHLMALKGAEDLRSTKLLDMYPTTESLQKLEVLYGEAITRADMDGTLKIEFVATHESRRSRRDMERASRGSMLAQKSQDSLSRDSFVPTDCHNEAFEDVLKCRPFHQRDFLAEQRKVRKQAWLDMLQRKEVRDGLLTATISRVLNRTAGSTGAAVDMEEPKIYLYSHQKENFKAKMWEELRQRVADDHHATYTFSQDFVSQTVCPVDEEELKKKEAIQSKAEWMTKKGFQYPKPKTRRELLLHPQKPSEARIEELHEPFTDILDQKQVRPDPTQAAREKGFHSRNKGVATFGALQEPSFEHEFQLKLMGDRTELPRGRLLNGTEVNNHFFRSVHLGGDDQARIVAEAMEKEKADWQAKVVVDSLDFKVGGMKVRDRPIQMDRATDILHDEAKRETLKHLRELKSHRGKPLGYTTAPLSLFSQEEYAPNSGNSLLRTSDPSKFITMALTGLGVSPSNTTMKTDDSPPKRESFPNTLDFQRYIHADTNKSKIVSMVAKRKHPAQDRNSNECTGPRWEAPAHY